MASAKRGKDKPVIQAEAGENKPKNKGQFVKGDVRINRHGRPKNHDQLRALIQRIAGESIGGEHPEWSRVEMMVRSMLVSRSPVDRVQIFEHGWGKVPQDLNVNVKDVERAIESELARLAGRSQVEDARTAESNADADDADGGAAA